MTTSYLTIHFKVYACFVALKMDEENFEDPETFKPERFINEATGQFVKSEKLIQFGAGKRRCPGQLLATSEIFLFLTNLVQSFEMRAAGPVDFSTVPGFIFSPVPFEVSFRPRN